jgi:hypothetical protein
VHEDVRDATGFTGIRLNIPAEVTVLQGPFRVAVLAEDNLLAHIETEVKGSSLRISSDRCLDPNIRMKVDVTLPVLEEIKINGSGDISVPDTFQVDRLELDINGSGNLRCNLIAAEIESAIRGSGDITLTGSANRHEAKILGSGDIHARDLPCNTAELTVNGSGSVFVYAIQNLDVRVNGSGDVHYKGKPAVTTRINGSGKVVDEN